MKRIKSDWHCNLGSDTLDELMRIKISGPQTLREFDPRPVVNRWWLCGESQKARHCTLWCPTVD